MASSTMIYLRNISPLASTAAVLPGHSLRFNIPGVRGVEPSSAAVEPATDAKSNSENTDVGTEEQVVHGVLYKLTEEDFGIICRTEGVPLAYSLHRCRVVPYDGDGEAAGADAMRRATSISTESERTTKIIPNNENGEQLSRKYSVPAFTLRAARKGWREGGDIPPSKSYLNVLIRGAKEFALDASYLEMLENFPVGRTWLGNGLAEEMLRVAELQNKNV